MGKLITPLIIAFFMGLSGGGFFTVWRTASAHNAAVVALKQGKPLPAHGDSTAADSAATDSTDADESHDADAHSPAATDSGAAPGAGHAAPDAAHAAPGTPVAPAAHTPGTGGGHGPAPAGGIAPDTGALPRALGQEARLAKLFGAMAPKDAARVLAQMDNRDVQTILNLVGDKQAAAILTQLPADRAVAFSQNQLRRGGTE